MISGSIGRRYAKALFSLAVDQNRVEPWADGLRALKATVEASPELRDVLQNPVYSKEQRRGVAAKLAEALKLDAEPASLLYLLSDRNRLAYLDGIADYFGELADAKLGRLRARVTTATAVDAASLEAISSRLSAATKAAVLVEHAVEPAIIGGVVAQIGSIVYDGSLRTQLEQLKTSLKQ
ncbi:MAG TPA: ATP synthase F1 subunit delta [Anaeromyxobacteraceae bacterium]|nr:ATP synthase F1 subunit delta [Anaeromyxobacteraceae bacterium]